MQLSFGKKKDARQSSSQELPGEAAGPVPQQKAGFWKSIDWKLMLALLFPMTLETLDYTVVATAQARIASIFNALPLESYIGTAYLLASTVFLPLFASIADIYGRHFGLQLSLLFFLIGSALSTGAMNMPMVIVGRGIAGIGAAGLLTIIRTLVSDTGSLNENNVQQSVLFLLYAIAFSVGPVIGGFLVAANFRWVFAINLPCTVLAMILCFIFLRNRPRNPAAHEDKELQPEGPSPHKPSAIVDSWISKLTLIDWVGTFLFVAGGILILLALNWGPNDNWKTPRVIANLVLGALLIVACLVWEVLLERRSPLPSDNDLNSAKVHTKYTGVFRTRPMLPIELFTSYDLCVTQYGSFTSGMVMFVMFYFVAIFATVVTGLPPGQAGIQLLYFSPGLGAGDLISIWLIKWLRQPIYSIVFGSVLMTVGVGLIQMAMQQNIQGQVNGFMVMVGAGLGMTAGPLVIQARFMKPNHVAITNAMMLFFRAFGGTIGLAQCFTILNAKVNSYIASQIPSLLKTFSASDLAALNSLLDSGGLTSLTNLAGLPSVVQTLIRDAFRDGVRWCFVSLIPWLGVGCILSLFLSRIPDSDKNDGGTVAGNDENRTEQVEMPSQAGVGEQRAAGTEVPAAVR